MGETSLPVIDKVRTGNKIKMLMQQKRITVSQLQLALGMPSATNVYAWLRGENIPNANNLVCLASLLDCKVDDLLITKEG